jgi:hypothetical protein
MSGEATLWVSTSIGGTLADQGTHSPLIETWEGEIKTVLKMYKGKEKEKVDEQTKIKENR